ncbi:hypothetical protein JANAI62_37230 [Jannaschia pagri]|uniref:Ca2+-binding protein, RTX toxin-related n=1 Tax=Jannaschia pagri TaxID=2829797 RepID=A0ABQ4NRQ9_9RHOB|nr:MULTISPECIES: calcium-binding protein [unclassified Jannaschia]GIT93233.1 hypothetical protein JANAI61_36910 [Jannaschia sp. AI_61]GIT97100.1 hypothetical protein JANAI62_37230 [Jannaschia sp. AI_62]
MPLTPESWLGQFTVNNTTFGPGGSLQEEPVVIQLTTGNIVVFWADNSDAVGGTGNGFDIIGQIYDPLGNEIGNEFIANGFDSDDEREFDAAALEDGRFVVVYTDDDGSPTSNRIRASEWTTNADGTIGTRDSLTIAFTPTAGDVVSKPSVASQSDGSYVVAYQFTDDSAADGSDTEVQAVRVAADATVGSPVTALAGSASSDITDIAALSNGNYVVVHEDRDSVRADDALVFRILDGTTGIGGSGAAFVTDTASNGESDVDASVIGLTGGGFVIAWQNVDSNDTDIKFQRYDNDGVAQGAVTLVDSDGTTDNNNEPHLIALADGGFVVAYDDDEDGTFAMQRFNAAGVSVGATVTRAPGGETQMGGIGLADGRFITTFKTTADIEAEIFDVRDNVNAPVYAPNDFQIGTLGDDTFSASSDRVFGHDGNDTITDGSGPNQVFGGAGNDSIGISAVSANESRDGGDDIDWLFGSGMANGTIYDLLNEEVRFSTNTEAVTNFENVRGSSANEEFIGDDGSNEISGEGGNDTIKGGFGFDSLNGGDGNDLFFNATSEGFDSIDGGIGDDTLNIEDTYVINLQFDLEAAIWGVRDFPNRTLLRVENIDSAAGNDLITGVASDIGVTFTFLGKGGNDTITGGANVEVIDGGDGNDSLDGGAGADSLDGGAGNDTLRSGEEPDAADRLRGGDDDDVLEKQSFTQAGVIGTFDGGAGTDLFFFSSSGSIDPTSSQVVDLGAERILFNGSNRDIVTNIENVRVAGAAGIQGDDGDNELSAVGHFANVIRGGGGDDTLEGGAGGDTLDGEDGSDTASYERSGARVVINLEANFEAGGDAAGDTLISIENLRGSAFSDILRGDDAANVIEGGADGDVIDGQDGSDTASYEHSDARVLVNLAAGFVSGGHATGDTLTSIENLRGSALDDVLRGDNTANVIEGGASADVIDGQGGSDTASYEHSDARVVINLGANFEAGGHAAGDTLTSIENLRGSAFGDVLRGDGTNNEIEGGAGADVIDGQGGTNLASYAHSDARVVINLGQGFFSGGDALGDTLLNIQNLRGSAFDDVIRGDDAANLVEGGDGNDELDGLVENDTLRGNDGDDTLIGGAGEDRLEGGDGVDSLSGGTFADRLDGGLGDDMIDGGSNFDTVLYVGLDAGVVVNLDAGTATGGGGTDTLVRVEHAFGSGFDDEITGTEIHGNRLEGSLGNDTLFGLAGNDVLIGGGNNDSLLGGANNDRLLGGSGTDFLDGGSGRDLYFGGSGADVFHFAAISEMGIGQFGRDEVRDFSRADGDKIDVSNIDADLSAGGDQAFSVVTTFSGAAAEMALVETTKAGVAVTIASLDVNGDAVTDAQIYVVGTVAQSDFIL